MGGSEWIVYSLLTALFKAVEDLAGKQALVRGAEPLSLAIVTRAVALPVLGLWLLADEMLQRVEWESFVVWLVVGGTLNALITVLYFHAIEKGEVSQVVPLTALTPVFLLITSPVMLQEVVSAVGAAGVLLVVAGVYMLFLGEGNGLLAPLREIGRRGSARLMLLIAVLWSITSNIDKLGIRASSPALWAFAINAYIFLILQGYWLTRWGRSIFRFDRWVIVAGVFSALMITFHMLALTVTYVPYLIAVKRTSVVFTALGGVLLFGEGGGWRRVMGAVLACSGVLLLYLSL